MAWPAARTFSAMFTGTCALLTVVSNVKPHAAAINPVFIRPSASIHLLMAFDVVTFARPVHVLEDLRFGSRLETPRSPAAPAGDPRDSPSGADRACRLSPSGSTAPGRESSRGCTRRSHRMRRL